MEIKLTKPQQRALQGLGKTACYINAATFHAKPYFALAALDFAVITELPNTDGKGAHARISEAGHAYLSAMV